MNLASVFDVVAGSARMIMIAVVAMALVRGTPASGQGFHQRCGHAVDRGADNGGSHCGIALLKANLCPKITCGFVGLLGNELGPWSPTGTE